MSDILLLQVTDSTEVMQKVAKLLDIPHVFCLNHCFALDVNEIDKANSPISVHCQKIHEALRAVKRSIKNVAILRSFTDLKVKVVDTCKWTKKALTTMRFDKLFEDLRKAAADEGSTSKMKADFYSPTIQKNNKTFSSQLNKISLVP